MKLRDVMRPGTYTIADTDGLGAAYAMMTRSRIRHLPVMRADRIVGILSERDVLAARARAGGRAWTLIPVVEAMQGPVQTAGPDDSLTEAAGRMAVSKIGALPVVEQGRMLGIATVSDVLAAEVRDAMMPRRPSLTAADAMTPYPFAVRPETLLVDAVAIMVDHHVRHLPVVDEHSTISGILSDRDVRSAIGDPSAYAEARSPTPVQLRVRDVMTRSAAYVPFDAPLVEIAKRFADDRIGAMPVTDKFGALIGMISYVDVLRALVAAD